MDEKNIAPVMAVRRTSPLLEVCRRMSINEFRLFYMGILAVKVQLQKFGCIREILIPTSEVMRLFGGNKGYYNELKHIAARLYEQTVDIDGEDCHIFSHIGFRADQGGLFIRFNDRIRPLIEEIAVRPAICLKAEDLFVLSSIYAVRILELILQYQDLPEFRDSRIIRLAVKLEDLKYLLNVPSTKTYEQITNIRHKVLDNPLSDINDNTGYRLGYQVVKDGRRVAGFVFTLVLP